MRAIRVRKRQKGERYAAHWLTDDEATRCGLDVEDLQVVEELDLEKLPPVEACHSCQRAVHDVEAIPRAPKPDAYYRQVLPASYGRISKQGSLRQTGRSGHGNRLRP